MDHAELHGSNYPDGLRANSYRFPYTPAYFLHAPLNGTTAGVIVTSPLAQRCGLEAYTSPQKPAARLTMGQWPRQEETLLSFFLSLGFLLYGMGRPREADCRLRIVGRIPSDLGFRVRSSGFSPSLKKRFRSLEFSEAWSKDDTKILQSGCALPFLSA